MPKSHNNQELFSNYYLEERLPERDTWQEPEGLTEAYGEIFELYHERKSFLKATKEAQTEEEWIKPILEILGFEYITRPSESIFDTTKVPDYAFFLNNDDKRKAYKAARGNKKDLFDFALAVGDAKRWGRDLNELSPNKQIDVYLRITDSKWGILTNGRLWRIYHLDSSYRLDTYYEVDLVDLIKAEELECFKYFYLFFRSRSFIEDGFLTKVYEGSEDFTASVSEDLKENAFDALQELCQGFLSENSELGKENLDDIYENSLILLYRLIFLLYAESDEEENLLPMNNEKYRKSYSLEALKKKVMEKKKNNESFLSSSHRYWGWLKELFSFIDKGEETLGVYEYNGGLFDSKKHPFLDEKYKIGNKYIAEVIRKVSYSEAENGFIDYQDLDVRELGAIYEGLLEHKPVVEKGQVIWKKDLSERKKTGSYYTPEYVVKYIVENTIGPLVEEKKEETEEEIEKIKEKLRGSEGDNRETYLRKLREKRKKVREDILDLKVLDPAMGSGHFLVEVTEKLANSIASLEEEFSTNKERKPKSKNTEPKDTVKELKRQIVERSIYGVDKNPLATELAKLSLWLHTVAKGEPLSFLDHHLRTGNSLVGIQNSEEIMAMPSGREERLLTSNLIEDLKEAIGHLSVIERIASESRADVQEKKTEWRDVKKRIKKYIEAANIRLSNAFENKVSDDQYWKVLQAIINDNTDKLKETTFFKKGQHIAEVKSFFHWELEFPDVFRNKQGKMKGDPGFDAIIGNPPWGAAIDTLAGYLEKQYPETTKKHKDSFKCFSELSLKLCRSGGFHSFITPNVFIYQPRYSDVRTFFLSNELKSITNLGEGIFKDVEAPTAIYIIKSSDSESYTYKFENLGILPRQEIRGKLQSKMKPLFIDKDSIQGDSNTLINYSAGFKNCKKLRNVLESFDCGVKHQRKNVGLQNKGDTDLRERLYYEANTKEDLEHPQDKPLLRGKDVSRFSISPSGYLVLRRNYEELLRENEIVYFNEEVFAKRKIIWRQTADSFEGAIEEQGEWIANTLQAGVLKDKNLTLEYILGILNSKYMVYLYQNSVLEKGRTFAQVKLSKLRELPIKMSNNRVNEVEELVQEISTKKDKFVLEKKEFLDWLSYEWGVSLDNLSLKTHLRAYWNYDFDEILRIAKKNKSQINESVDSRDFKELMKKEWESSMKELRPLLRKIDELETQLDAIVFDLYRLSEDKVKTVLHSLDTPEEEKSDILQKFRQVG